MQKIVIGLFVGLSVMSSAFGQHTPRVAFTAIVEHPALDAVRFGAIERLKERGYVDGKNLKITFDSAQGQPSNAAQIASKIVGEKPDVIVAASTPSAQAALAATSDIPIVFSAVTDPVAAKLVHSLENPGKNVTGVSDAAPVGLQIDLALQIKPDIRRIGVIYNPGETNSIALMKILKKVLMEKNLQSVEAGAAKTSDLSAAAESLVGKVDAIYLPTDNVVASGLEAIIGITREHKIPTIGASEYVERGVVIGGGYNYLELGKETGTMVADIIEGKNPGTIPVVTSPNIDIIWNVKEANAMGIKIPETIMKKGRGI